MGQKVNPIGFRVGVSRSWDSTWFADENYIQNLHEDIMLRNFIHQKLKRTGIMKIAIERLPDRINISIHTARPGVVIGQKGARIEALKEDLRKKCAKRLHVGIVEVKKPEAVAQVIADGIAHQLEQRMPFRRVMKQALRGGMRSGLDGVKINVSGRLNGADMARTECYKDGRIPLHTLRANVDYACSEANTVYGITGVKVWTYHGDFLSPKKKAKEDDYIVKPKLALR